MIAIHFQDWAHNNIGMNFKAPDGSAQRYQLLYNKWCIICWSFPIWEIVAIGSQDDVVVWTEGIEKQIELFKI